MDLKFKLLASISIVNWNIFTRINKIYSLGRPRCIFKWLENFRDGYVFSANYEIKRDYDIEALRRGNHKQLAWKLACHIMHEEAHFWGQNGEKLMKEGM